MMKKWYFVLVASAMSLAGQAATINWSAGIDHGFSLENGAELPVGSLVRLGWFRDPSSGAPLSDTQIQAIKTSTNDLDLAFVEVGRTTVGSGFTPPMPGHFSAVAAVGAGSNLAGKQMFLWVLNAATIEAADEQAILYWSIGNTTANPDNTVDAPGIRWRFPEGAAFPGSTTIDLTDLTVGTGSLGAGARLLVGNYPNGTSSASGFANFGLSNLYQPPIVKTATLLAGGKVGVLYRQELSAIEGTPSFTWDIIGGELPNGLVMDAAGVISGRPTFAGTYLFLGRATDLVGNPVSREFSLTIAALPLLVASSPVLPDAGLNAQYALNLQAAGGTAPYSWEIASGALPEGMTLSSSGLLSGTPTVGGNYAFAVNCKDDGGLQTSQTFSLRVQALTIATGTLLKKAILGRSFLHTFAAVGGSPPYTWSLVGGALPPSQLPGSILSPAGVLNFVPSAEGTSTFTLEVRDGVNATTTQSFTLEVVRVPVAPTVDTPVFSETTNGAAFTHQLTGSNNAVRFSASGLPRGLVLNALTGVISGRPVISGRFPVTVRAANSAGRSPPAVAILVVRSLSGGRFIGSIGHDVRINRNIGGRLDLTTTKHGGYSLKLTHGGAVKRYKGRIQLDTDGSPIIQFMSGTTQVRLAIEGDLLSGTIQETGAGGSSVAAYGWRSIWNDTFNEAVDYIGHYSMGIDVLSVPLAEVRPLPEGTGYAHFQVKRNGTLTVKGRAADGSVLLTPGFIGPDGEILVHTALYSKRGSVTGRLQLRLGAERNASENTVEGALTWLKPAVSSRTYSAGFGPLTLSTYGKYLARSAKGLEIFGLPVIDLAAGLAFSEGGVEGSATNPDIEFTYTDARRVELPTPGGVQNPGRTRLRIPFVTTKGGGVNGVFSGSFRLIDGRVTRNAKFQGMIIRGMDDSTKAYGYFLLPQLPVGTERLSQTPILSGQVTISQ